MAEQEYDIVIVGAGTAGCVLANRLSEDPNISVLVIEAGEDRNKDERVFTPGLVLQLWGNPDFDWQYVSEPSPGINGRQIKHPRGRVLGGTSAINSFALIYPSAAAFDAWAALGNEGWNWNGVKDYFRKFVTVSDPSEAIRSDFKAVSISGTTKGSIQASYPVQFFPIQKTWVETFQTLNLENTTDPLDGAALGGYVSTNHISEGTRERSHAGVAYYEPVRARKNLTLVTGALVQKILFDRSSRGDAKAVGVSYIKDGQEHHITSRKEVLLSAGTIASPQLLELSGIGDSALLRQHRIETVYNNPNVGENLQDHIKIGLSYEAAEGAGLRSPVTPAEARRLYEEERKGPWAETACYSFAYLPLDQFLSSSEKQKLSHLFDQDDLSTSTAFEKQRNAFIKAMALSPSEATATAYLSRRCDFKGAEGKEWITLFAMLSHPYSRGSVHITSSDVAVKPNIDFRYYSHPLDLEIHARHLQSLDRISKTAPLSDSVKKNGARLPIHFEDIGLDQAKEIIKEYSTTNYHPSSTCSMMPEEIGGVVDNHLRVYGTTGLRVVDGSVIPITPRGNIISTIYALAEKAADIISRDLNIQRTTM